MPRDVPLCDECWSDILPDRQPVRLVVGDLKYRPCEICGQRSDGIVRRMREDEIVRQRANLNRMARRWDHVKFRLKSGVRNLVHPRNPHTQPGR